LHLFVADGRRGQGIGRNLIGAAQAHARATGAIRLTIGTSPSNPSAAQTYRAMGWDEVTVSTGPRFQIGFWTHPVGGGS
jgi:GNAT superfamily N-acetyltransferase